MKKQLSRREMLRWMGTAIAAGTVVGCTPKVTATPVAVDPTAAEVVEPTKAGEPTKAVEPTKPEPTATTEPTLAPTAVETLNITWMIPTQQKVAVSESEIIKAIQSKFNVKFNFTESPPDDTYTEKKKLALASQDLPDILSWVTMEEANQYGPDGAFLEITPLLARMPNLKATLDSDPFGKYNAYTTDEKVWRVPDYNVSSLPIYDFSYAKAEFDAIGATELNTWDQVYEALKKLKEKYPDSYPFTFRAKEVGAYGLKILFEMSFTEGKNGAWVRSSDNNIAFEYDLKKYIVGAEAPGFKDSISFLAKLYKEGLLDPEYLTIDMNQLIERFKNKKAFMTVDFVGGLSGVVDIQKQIDNILFPLPTPYVTGKKQVIAWAGAKIGNRGTALNGQLEGAKLDRIIEVMDYVYSQEFFDLLYWNPAVAAKDAKGVMYYTNEGMYNRDPAVWDIYLPWSIAANFLVTWDTTVQPGTPYADYKINWLAAPANADKYVPLPTLPFTADQTRQIGEYQTSADEVFNAQIDNFVMNKDDMAQWEDFISKIKAAGDDELVKIYNEVYQKYFA